jgi:hypothetical protein
MPIVLEVSAVFLSINESETLTRMLSSAGLLKIMCGIKCSGHKGTVPSRGLIQRANAIQFCCGTSFVECNGA